MADASVTGYLAPKGFETHLESELQKVVRRHDGLFLAEGPPQNVHWCQNVWYEPQRMTIDSIKDGASKLRRIQRDWSLYSHILHRRAALIESQLPRVNRTSVGFPTPLPSTPLGSWTMLDETTLLVAPNCSSLFPHGEINFVEDKQGPPSRAYLKLWEALTIAGTMPKPKDRVIELGASPGGWTWVLARLGAEVTAIDRAPLAPAVAAMAGVHFEKKDAFSLRPEDVEGEIDWLVSDVICYPDKLFEYVKLWLDSGRCRRFVVTVKFQGDAHYGVIKQFASLPGGRLVHLYHNKHELTFIRT